MAVNEVIYNGETLIDLKEDTVTPQTLAEGVTAHDASGNLVVGTMPTQNVLYVEQDLTEAQKERARLNIGIDEDFKTEIAALVIEMLGGNPIFGIVDENNNIILSGNLADGTYTAKYEMEDGSTVDIGNLVIAEEEPEEPPLSYTNVLPLAIDANDNLYVGDNGEKGYNINKKISTSTGNESSADACVSGFIELPVDKDSTVRIKNITVSSAASVNNIAFYDADKARKSGYAGSAGAFNQNVTVKDGVYTFKISAWFTQDNLPTYFRFSCASITDKTIVTINEEIV